MGFVLIMIYIQSHGLPLQLSVVYLVITRELFTLFNLFIGTDIITKIYINQFGNI